jgi:hypothetical protein
VVARRAVERRADVPDRRAVVARRAVPPDLRAVVARRVVLPARRAVGLRAVVFRAVVFRRAVDARRDVLPEALRAARAPERLPPGSAFSAAFSASLATLRALFSQEALPLRRFAGSFLSCFSMLSRVVP